MNYFTFSVPQHVMVFAEYNMFFAVLHYSALSKSNFLLCQGYMTQNFIFFFKLLCYYYH